jgi:hypothetical protein
MEGGKETKKLYPILAMEPQGSSFGLFTASMKLARGKQPDHSGRR